MADHDETRWDPGDNYKTTYAAGFDHNCDECHAHQVMTKGYCDGPWTVYPCEKHKVKDV